MARAQLRARFFATEDGEVWEKAPPVGAKMRRRIFDRDGWRCRYCGVGVTWLRWESRSILSDTRPGAVDHILPRSRGGSSDEHNLVLACESCNAAKGAY